MATDFERDLDCIQSDLAAPATASGCAKFGQAWLLYRRLQVASLTGDMGALPELASRIDCALQSGPQSADLILLKIHIALKRHRFAEAEQTLQAHASLRASPFAQLFLSDIYVQFGRYSEALALVEGAIATEPTWDALARAAHFAWMRGDTTKAESLYDDAEEELTAKQMQTFAWLQLQRGWLQLQRGEYAQARVRYNRAKAAYTGYWLTEERLAELDGAEGYFPEAIVQYQRLYAESPRPEWAHAIGDLYLASANILLGAEWKQKAYDGYQGTLQSGEVYHLHCLADLCCELSARQSEAVQHAQRDLSMRENFLTRGNLAWALYRDGRVTEAVAWMNQALASGMASPLLFLQAACIYAAAHLTEQSQRYMTLFRTLNPRPARVQLRSPLRLSSIITAT